MEKTVGIIGDGAMGTLCAILLAARTKHLILWGRRKEHTTQLAAHHENAAYLPHHKIPDSVIITSDDAMLAQADLLLCAVPTQFIRSVFTRLAPHLGAKTPIISLAKGIENTTLLRPTQIISQVLAPRSLAAVSGPSIAGELARGLPATIVAAAADEALAVRAQKLFAGSNLRVYVNNDLTGVELAGAMKNVIAIAAGILDGLRAGTNAKASLLTRGLVEISRLGIKLGAKAETFSGLAGLGDLVTTCFSLEGRNRTFGQHIGEGLSPEQAQSRMNGVVEGVATTISLMQLSRQLHVEMPIARCLNAVLFEGKSPQEGIRDLMSREPKTEH